MKKSLFKMILLALVAFVPASAVAGVSVHVNIPLPPPIVFPAPPALVVIPQTDVYVIPDVNDDIFFYGGWWWRPWQGRWYRSHYVDRGWAHYRGVPSFHRIIPPHWRNDYRANKWMGNPWHHQRIPQNELRRNWRAWERDRHWERHSWGVEGLPPKRPHRDMRHRPQETHQPHEGKPYVPAPENHHP